MSIKIDGREMSDDELKDVIEDHLTNWFSDNIRKYDYTNSHNGNIVYTIIVCHRIAWLDIISDYCIMSESERDTMFDDLCSGNFDVLKQWIGRWFGFSMRIVSDQEPPNMTDHRIGERNVK